MGPGIEPVSPALAGGFLTTAPPGKSLLLLLMRLYTRILLGVLYTTYKTRPYLQGMSISCKVLISNPCLFRSLSREVMAINTTHHLESLSLLLKLIFAACQHPQCPWGRSTLPGVFLLLFFCYSWSLARVQTRASIRDSEFQMSKVGALLRHRAQKVEGISKGGSRLIFSLALKFSGRTPRAM